jgi:hypothetical protein
MSEKKPLTEGYQPNLEKKHGYQPSEQQPQRPEPDAGYVPETGQQQQQQPIPPPTEE